MSVLELNRVKNYLRVDSDFDDAEIQSMIDAAATYFENETNVLLTQREIVYNTEKIYDFPIADTEGLEEGANLYFNKSGQTVTLDVGYDDPTDIPKDIQQCLLQIIKVWYYESEKEQNETLLPISVKQVIAKYKRFWF